MQSMFLTTITTIALLAGASAAHQKDTTFFAMIGGRCGQVTMPDDMAVHLTALLKTGTCTDKGFTVQQGTEVLPIPTLGDVTLSLYHRPTTTDMPLEDGMLDDTVDTQDDGCKAVSSATGDAGYTDSYRGWYDVQGCGKCNDYCRWVGDTGSGGDPSKKLQVPGGKNPSWWSCRLAGGSSNYSTRNHFKSFPYKKCSGKGAEAPGPNCINKDDGSVWCKQSDGSWTNKNTGEHVSKEQAANYRKTGCVQKDDGLWCEQSDGSWTNKNTGEDVSKEQAANYEKTGCVQKDDGLWCETSKGTWTNKKTGQTWSQQAAKPDENGCYKKEDGVWCPGPNGSWTNKNTGENVSKEQAATYEQTGCVQKDDGRWCKQSDGSWVNVNTGQTWNGGKAKADENGCYNKYDGLWCPGPNGSWINKDTGKTATKAQVEKCVQKADGLWCPHGWGSWINTDSGEIWSGSHHFEAWVWIYGAGRAALFLSLLICLCYACTSRGRRSSRSLVVFIDRRFGSKKNYEMQVDAPVQQEVAVVQGEAVAPPPVYDADMEKAIAASLAEASAPPAYA